MARLPHFPIVKMLEIKDFLVFDFFSIKLK
jgi:hypothetical protein